MQKLLRDIPCQCMLMTLIGYLSIRKGANATQFAASSVSMAKAKVKLSQYYFSGIYLPYHRWVFISSNFF